MEMDHPYGSGHVCSIILFWERGGLVERRDEEEKKLNILTELTDDSDDVIGCN